MKEVDLKEPTTMKVWNKFPEIGLTKETAKKWNCERLEYSDYENKKSEFEECKTGLIVKADGHILLRLQRELEKFDVQCLTALEEETYHYNRMIIRLIEEGDVKDA